MVGANSMIVVNNARADESGLVALVSLGTVLLVAVVFLVVELYERFKSKRDGHK